MQIKTYTATEQSQIQVETWCMGPYTGVDYNSPYVNSRVDSNIFTMGNPMPESTLTLCQSLLYPQPRDLRFSLGANLCTVCTLSDAKKSIE
jgi:hypothetical protein